jgi:hypothetical protein
MIDIMNNKELFTNLLTDGIPVFENKDLFLDDKEFYFKDLSKAISDDLPYIFSWYCDKSDSLVLEIDSFKEFGRISYEGDRLLFFKGDEFENHSPLFLMSTLIAVMRFEGLIEKSIPADDYSEEDSEEESDSAPEWL